MTLPAATPALSVTYGDVDIDEGNGCVLSAYYDKEETSTDLSFYVEFRLRLLNQTNDEDADDATFAAMVAAIESDETGLRVARQKLVAKIGSREVANYETHVTAIAIQPELKLIEANRRDYRYGFRVRAQALGNVPGNVRRRESFTRVGASQREHRQVTITATWTSGDGLSAYEQFLDSGPEFFEAYLPANITDAFGNRGQWTISTQDPVQNDERSICTASVTFLEVFDGRRDSSVLQIQTIGSLRALSIPSLWLQTSASALENYIDNGGAFFDSVLGQAPNIDGGEWVLVDEQFAFVDTKGTLQATRVYQECVDGLRDYKVRVTADASDIRTVVIQGTFYETSAASARENYLAGISDLVHDVMEQEGVVKFESTSVPLVTGYGVTKRTYDFVWTLKELAYAESLEQDDDPKVKFEALDVEVDKPFGPMSISEENPVERLRTGTARFTANVSIKSGDDPATLWDTRLRAHVRNAIVTKLGDDVRTVEVYDETLGVGLDRSVLTGTLRFLVRGSGILSCQIIQALTLVPGRSFVPRADGTPYSVRDYRDAPEKLLHREIVVEYLAGSTPSFFEPGDIMVSGFGMIDTGKTGRESNDDQNSDDELVFNEWYIDRRQSPPYHEIDIPTTRGDTDGFETVLHRQIENWMYVSALEPGTVIS